jgi:hypothetical protein
MEQSMFPQKMVVPPCRNFLITLQYSMRDIELYQDFKNFKFLSGFNPTQSQS